MRLRLWSVLAGLVLLVHPARTQIVAGSVGGTVVDRTQAVISNARVTLVNQNTEVPHETASSDTGSFLFPTLPPGWYRLSVLRASFKTAVISDIDLQIDQAIDLGDVVMEPGLGTESITVEASAVALQTESATLGQVFSERTIVDLPLNGRNFLQLATLSAGVVPATSGTATGGALGRPEATIHVTGGRSGFTSYLLDGQESRGFRLGEATFLPSPDVILEFKAQRNFYSAEYGSSPAIVSVSTKSGGNALHGSLYEFLRNSALDAPSYFDGGSPPPFRLNQFGGTLGGPVISNRTFFFGGYEGRRQRLATQSFATVPTPAMLSGDFSSLNTAIKDPFNNGIPFPNNRVPVNAIAFALNKYYPAPNTSSAQGNYVNAPNATNDLDQYHVRIDHHFTDRDRLFGRYSQSDWIESTPGLLPYSGTISPLNAHNAVVQETHILNATFLNTLKLGYSRGLEANFLQPVAQNPAVQAGFQNLVADPNEYVLPRIQIRGFTSLGDASSPFRSWSNNYSLSDTVNLIRGRHSMAFGGDVRAHRAPVAASNNPNGRLEFVDRFTGNALADYLVGAYAAAGAGATSVVRDYRYTQYALFFQDNYKVSPRLTLNVGLRWEYNQPMRELGGSEGFFDPSTGTLRLANSPSIYGIAFTSASIQVGGLREGIAKPRFLNFAPRVGFAYRIGTKTVLRGGVGIFYAAYLLPDQGTSVNPGASYTASYINSPGTIPRLSSTLFDKIVAGELPDTTQLSVSDPNRKAQYMGQASFEIQRELPGSLFFEIGYVGNQGHHLIGRRDLNQAVLNAPGQNLPVKDRRPFPQFANINQFYGGENSNYQGLTAVLERRFASGVGFLANYTLSKAMDAFSGTTTDFHQIPNFRLDYGRAAFDVRHRFSGSASYELPFGAGKRYLINTTGLAKWAVSGWQINTIVQFQSGLPFSVFLMDDVSNTGVMGRQRPNRVADGALPPSQRTPGRWFDTGAFALNPLNTYGNAGRNILEQDGVKTVDFSALKTTSLTERLTLQFRAEIFNLFDAENFGPPGPNLGGANFGVVTTVGPARQVQLALKLFF